MWGRREDVRGESYISHIHCEHTTHAEDVSYRC